MLRRSTWFALAILAALIVLAVYLNRPGNGPAISATSTPESQPLFGAEAGQLESIVIDAGIQGRFEMARGTDQSWVIRSPVEASADPAQAEAAVTQVNALRLIADVDVSPGDVGLTKPAYTLTLGFSGDTPHILRIGDQTPSTAGYYASLDDGSVVIVSGAGIEGLLTLLTTPPYKETPTPSPIPPTETPSPAAGPETTTPGSP